MLSMIAISSLNDQFSCRSFCTSVLTMASSGLWVLKACLCAHLLALLFLFLPLSYSLIFLYMTIALMVMYMPRITLSLYYGCVWIASVQWIAVTWACMVFLCCTGIFLIVFLKSVWEASEIFLGISIPVACDLQSCLPHGQNICDGIFLGHLVCPVIIILYLHSRFPHLLRFCL